MKTFRIFIQSQVNSMRDIDLDSPELFTTDYTIDAETYYEASQKAKEQHRISVWESWGDEIETN